MRDIGIIGRIRGDRHWSPRVLAGAGIGMRAAREAILILPVTTLGALAALGWWQCRR